MLLRGRKTVSTPKFWSPGWDLHVRAPNGELQPNAQKFPKGIKAVADYVKGLGDGPFRFIRTLFSCSRSRRQRPAVTCRDISGNY